MIPYGIFHILLYDTYACETRGAVIIEAPMITVIIAGGSGTRLWPLSTSDYPKHLLKLTGERSMLQLAYDRARRIGDTVYIVTEASHSDHVREQLSDLSAENILIEPGRRGTGSCLVMALDAIARREDKDEPIAFITGDHHIRDIDGYARSIQSAGEASNVAKKVTLLGIEPTYPATGFGYIERDDDTTSDEVYNITTFKEKPDLTTAQNYLHAGNYLWNSGYFIGSANTFLSEIERVSPELFESYQKLAAIDDTLSDTYRQVYLDLPELVTDYALAEKSDNLAVVPANFDWMDIGSFKDLHEANDADTDGNVLKGEKIYGDEIENVLIQNDEDKPVVAIGLDNVVIINTPHGILVARKDLSQKVKDAVTKIKADEE